MENLSYDEYHQKITEVFNKYNVDFLLHDLFDNFKSSLNNYKEQRKVLLKKMALRINHESMEEVQDDLINYKNELKKYVQSMNDVLNKVFLAYKIGNFSLYNNFSSVDENIKEIDFLWENIKRVKFYSMKDFDNNFFLKNGILANFEKYNYNPDYIGKVQKLSENKNWSKNLQHQKSFVEENFDTLFGNISTILKYITIASNEEIADHSLSSLDFMVNNLQKIHLINTKVIEDISEFEHNRIIKVINSMKKNYGLNVLVNSSIICDGEMKKSITDEDIDNIDVAQIHMYLKGIEFQTKLIQSVDKNASLLLSKVPTFLGHYFPMEGAAAIFISISNKLIEESGGFMLLNKINKNFTIFAHEYEHFKDAYILNKVNVSLKKEQKTEKNFIDKGFFKYLSEYYMDNLVSSMLYGKSIIDNIEDGIVKNAFALAFEKQDIYYFENLKEKSDVMFKDNQYNTLRERICFILSKEVITEFMQLEVDLTGKTLLFDKIKSNRDVAENLISSIQEYFSQSIATDILIHDIKNKDSKNPTLQKNGGVSFIGKLGSRNSSFLLLKTLQECVLNMFETIPEITKEKLLKNQLEKENQIKNTVNNIMGLKTVIKIRQIIDEYPEIKMPTYYATNGSVKGFLLNEEVLSNNIKRIFNGYTDKRSELSNYFASPVEIYARNAQAIVSKKFINKKNVGFLENANKEIMIKIANQIEKLYSSERRKEIKIGSEYSKYFFSSLNMFIEELSDRNLERIEEINDELMSIIKRMDSEEVVFKIKDEKDYNVTNNSILNSFKNLMLETKIKKKKIKVK